MITNSFYRPVLFGTSATKKQPNYLDKDGYLKEEHRDAFKHPLILTNQPIVLGALPQLTQVGDFEMHVIPMFGESIKNHSTIREAVYTALERFFNSPKLPAQITHDKQPRFNTVYDFIVTNPLRLDLPPSLVQSAKNRQDLRSS
jgi:hypothetical protein